MNAWWLWLLAAAALGLLFALLWLRLRRAFRSWQSRRRGRVARRAEQDAEKLLQRQGFRVLERQSRLRWSLYVDDEPMSVELRADLIVEKAGQLWVAEVKSGELATQLSTAATRRQLLEYAFAYDCHGVLLVDMQRRRVHELRFVAARQQHSLDARPKR